MAVRLQNDEKIIFQANLHWSSYIVPACWAFLGSLSMLGMLIGNFSETNPKSTPAATFLMVGIVFFGPLLLRFLRNKFKVYAVTNKRVLIEEGIIAKKKIDLPFQKVNDIQMSQGIFQRMLGSGNVQVWTGNSKPLILRDIDTPEDFKNHLFDTTQQSKTAA